MDMKLTPDDFMRRERFGKLADEVDKPMRNYLHSGQAIPQNLINYRQALLDVPENSTPAFDGDGELTGVTWPTKPE